MRNESWLADTRRQAAARHTPDQSREITYLFVRSVQHPAALSEIRTNPGQRRRQLWIEASLYIDASRRNVTSLRAFHAVLGAAFVSSPLPVEIAALKRNTVESFATTIRQGIVHGEIREDVAASAQGALIVASLRGAMTQWPVDPARVDLDGSSASSCAT